jgi:hypothetical protein
MGDIIFLMEAIIKEPLKIICHMEMDNSIGQMELNIKVNGKMEFKKV